MASTPTADPTLESITAPFRFGRLVANENPLMNAEIYALRYNVYCIECGFLNPKNYESRLESDEYDVNSVHFTAHNEDNELVGSVRLVLSGLEQRFPFEDHCTELFNDVFLPARSESGEVSRLVVRQNYRRRVGDTLAGVPKEFMIGSSYHLNQERPVGERRSSSPRILLGLYREMYQYSVSSGIRYWYAAMERSLARALARLQFVFEPIGMQTDYYGPVTPYLADLRKLEERLADSDRDLLAWFRKGL